MNIFSHKLHAYNKIKKIRMPGLSATKVSNRNDLKPNKSPARQKDKIKEREMKKGGKENN